LGGEGLSAALPADNVRLHRRKAGGEIAGKAAVRPARYTRNKMLPFRSGLA
jgi:hypothetical protein